jgi:hypothetical protein
MYAPIYTYMHIFVNTCEHMFCIDRDSYSILMIIIVLPILFAGISNQTPLFPVALQSSRLCRICKENSSVESGKEPLKIVTPP